MRATTKSRRRSGADYLAALTLLAAVALSGLTVQAALAQSRSQDHIVDVAQAAGQFGTLLAAAEAAGLVGTLQGDGPFTVFAPTDEAFSNLPDGTVESLLKPGNRDQLRATLTYHVVPGRVPASTALSLTSARTMNGQRLALRADGGSLMVDEATVVAVDVNASNGVIHVIDAVLIPEDKTVIGVAKDARQFRTLLAAVDAAGLTPDLMGAGPFTVFAPTDDAFDALPSGTVESLLEPVNREQLRAILAYHVVPGRVYSDALLGDRGARTLQGERVEISVTRGQLWAAGKAIVATDIDASNGVVHVIDGVLIPGPSAETLSMTADWIRRAIDLGAPLYNARQPAACADVYEATAKAILAMDSGLPSGVSEPLRRALSQAEHESDASARAWTMRNGLDAAYLAARSSDRSTEGHRRMSTKWEARSQT